MSQLRSNHQLFHFNFEIIFSSPIDKKLLCMLCRKILINAHQVPCRCKLCLNCCKELMEKNEDHCPICGVGKITSVKDFEVDHKTNSRVLGAVVKCPNVFCSYECELGSMSEHVDDCFLLQQVKGKASNFDKSSENFYFVNLVRSLSNKLFRLTENEKQNKIEMNELKQKLESCDDELNYFKEKLNQNQQCLESLEETVKILKYENEELKRKMKKQKNTSVITLTPTYDTHKPKPFLWRITEFSKKHQEAKLNRKTIIFSDPFYSNYNGYKLCLGMYPNGVNQYEGRYLFVFFCILPSQNDDNLSWPMRHQVSLSILDHNTLKDHKVYKFMYFSESRNCEHSFSRPESDKNDGIGDNEFISFNELATMKNICKNDTILIKCVIDPK